MSPLAVSLTLAIAMALTAGGAFLYLRMTARRPFLHHDGVFPQARGFDHSAPTKCVETGCSATYVPVEGPAFTGTFPPPQPAGPEPTRDIRRGQSPELDVLIAADAEGTGTDVTRELRGADDADTLFEKVIVGHDGLRRRVADGLSRQAADDSDLEAPTDRYGDPVKPRAAHTIPRSLVS